MNKRELEYPVELESQFIMRLPEEPAKALRAVLQSGENFKNRLTIQIENDMRHGAVRFDHWLLPGKIIDLPTIVESLKTIDRKSVYKTADISQMMICKDELDSTITEEETPAKNKKKDPYKVDKKFLLPHGITPPTKNVRKRRFRKTLKKKSVDAPEIEKEVKRLLRADNEAVSVTWEVITEENDNNPTKAEYTPAKAERAKAKREPNPKVESDSTNQSASKVEDIFGGTLSDSDLEDEHVNVDIDESRMSLYEEPLSDSNSVQGTGIFKSSQYATQFKSEMFQSPQIKYIIAQPGTSSSPNIPRIMKGKMPKTEYESDDRSDISMKMQQVSIELEELKQRKQRTQHEISGMDNMTLRQRFQDILQTISQDIMYKEMEYRNLQALLK